jgi:hypothetical protein
MIDTPDARCEPALLTERRHTLISVPHPSIRVVQPGAPAICTTASLLVLYVLGPPGSCAPRAERTDWPMACQRLHFYRRTEKVAAKPGLP